MNTDRLESSAKRLEDAMANRALSSFASDRHTKAVNDAAYALLRDVRTSLEEGEP